MLVNTVLAVVLAIAAPRYLPPVPGPVVDDWRPPSSAYGAGNRGVELAAAYGDPVRAAADGVVVYAGRIGPQWHVVVLHDDGLRTSYSFLASAVARRGDAVAAGDVVGIADGAVHFGVRAGDVYLDPLLFLAGDGPVQVHLVPERERAVGTEAEERRGLLAQVGGAVAGAAGRVGEAATAVGGLVGRFGWDRVEQSLRRVEGQLRRYENGIRSVAHWLNEGRVDTERRLVREQRVLEDQEGCTPRSTATPTRPAAGRIALLVGGLGSSTGGAAVLDVDTEALGYDETIQFSYNGGDEPYAVTDTHGDIEAYGDLLRERLVQLARERPGVAVDVISHSMGGLVTRAGLSGADAFAPDMPVVANVVTLASPHHGTTWATASAVLQLQWRSRGLLTIVDDLSFGRVPAMAESTGQMASAARFIAGLADDGLPANTRVTSIAASGDWTVDDAASAIDDATNVVVPLSPATGSWNPHDALPGDPETQREIALAVAGMGPQCRDHTGTLPLASAIELVNSYEWAEEAVRADLARLPGPDAVAVHSPVAPGGTRPPG